MTLILNVNAQKNKGIVVWLLKILFPCVKKDKYNPETVL